MYMYIASGQRAYSPQGTKFWCQQKLLVTSVICCFLVPEKKIYLGFYHIWAWWPSWSCDQDHLSKHLFPHPIEAPYEIWIWLALWFLRRRCLKSVDDYDDNDDDGPRRRPTYPISSPMSLRPRWAKKKHNDANFPSNEWSLLCAISWNMVANILLYN